MTEPRPFGDPNVAAAFAAYSDDVRDDLFGLRELVFETAGEIEDIGPLIETLKWGQPAYLPERPRTGSTLRIDAVKSQPGQYAMYFHCQTSLVSSFREIYGDQFAFEGNRALVFSHGQALPVEPLKHCIAMTLTYHVSSGASRRSQCK